MENGEATYQYLEPITSGGIMSTSTTIVDGSLTTYLQTIFDYALVTVTVIAIFMLMYGGIQYLTTDIASKKSGGKEIIVRAITGLIFVFSVWFILNLINPDLTKTLVDLGGNTATNIGNAVKNGNGTNVSSGDIPINISTGDYPWPTGKVAGVGVTCNGGKLTKAWTKTACFDNYKTYILAASTKYGVDKNLIRAFIYQESTGNANAVSGNSYGLMQIEKNTAEILGCQSGWQSNPEKNIDCGTRYLKSAIDKGISNYNLYAGYNGGYGAATLGESNNCSGGLLKWQCAFDNTTHTTCNTGYEVSRNYSMSIDFWKKKLDNNNCSW